MVPTGHGGMDTDRDMLGRLSEDSFHASPLASRTREAVDSGGQYRPGGCVPREKVAVIIPYRDREQNLKVQLHHLHSVLQRQNLQYGIYVVEMAYPTPFNRGLLANVGFLVASDVIPYTCYVIHDVDLLVMDDRNLYRCGRVPRHLLAHSTKYGKLPYVAYFGGVVALKERHLRAVNGFSNLYFGWGGEDDDLLTRIFQVNLHISRPKPLIGGFYALQHQKDSGNPVNQKRDILLKSAKERMFKDGISSVQYTLLALEKRPLFTWVYIAVNETDIPKKFQEYFQR
ncbi:beta-1,4-N-acetylgalactosaminyltransferase bre-4-like [Dreissena polymorpha]|uniref:beta-1,4-N-acetylgalactosaminyltransferase bre-4-like n=1 Tax=Dreissena polymorpha TaxID=45954 RepID=UPI002263E092|nr:beta-1,4-N-acetylgalactosaminyltransferase bre-4-like [Dreissena polymorpha]